MKQSEKQFAEISAKLHIATDENGWAVPAHGEKHRYQESEALSRAVVAISISSVIAIRYRIGKDGFGEKVWQ